MKEKTDLNLSRVARDRNRWRQLVDRKLSVMPLRPCTVLLATSSRSSDGNSSLLDEGGSASQVPQATLELAGYGNVVWPDSLSEWLADGAGL